MLAGGAAVVAGMRLALPGLLPMDDPAEAFGHVGALGLTALGVASNAGGLEVSLPALGVLVVTGWGIVSSLRSGAVARGGLGRTAEPPRGSRVAVTFGLLCGAVAIVTSATGAGLRPHVLAVTIAGLYWGGVFAVVARTLRLGRARGPGTVMVGSLFGLGVAALAVILAWQALSKGPAPATALGGLLLAAAYAPNLIAALVSVSLGAPVELALGGELSTIADHTGRFALWDWGAAGGAPWWAWTLVAVPLGSLLLTRRWATFPARTPGAVFSAAIVTGIAVTATAWLGRLSVASGSAAFHLEVPPGMVFPLASAWGALAAFVTRASPRVEER